MLTRFVNLRDNVQVIHSVFPLSKGGREPKLGKFQKGGNLKTNLGWEKPKRGRERRSKRKGRIQLFKLNSGIKNVKNRDF